MMALQSSPGIEIRHCTTLAEYEECVRVQRSTWGREIAMPSAAFVVAHHTGGQVLGAFEQAGMVGFTLGFAGARHGRVFLHSHMTAVLGEYRDRGIGRQLKLFQRQEALHRKINLVEWTFDPLEARNAYFNLARLGAVVRRLIPNCYGVTPSPLHGGLPTDRLVAEWWIGSDRVSAILAGGVAPEPKEQKRVKLPANWDELKNNDRPAALRAQADVREQLQKLFAEGYAAVDLETDGGALEYILEPVGRIAGLRLSPEPPADGAS